MSVHEALRNNDISIVNNNNNNINTENKRKKIAKWN